MSIVIMLLSKKLFRCIFRWYFNAEMGPKYEEIILFSSSKAFIVVYPNEKQYCCPVLELFNCLLPRFGCLPLWKTWKKGTNCNKLKCYWSSLILCYCNINVCDKKSKIDEMTCNFHLFFFIVWPSSILYSLTFEGVFV